MVSQVSYWGASQGGSHRQDLVVKEGSACWGLCPGLTPFSKPRSAKDLGGYPSSQSELQFTPLPNGERVLVG